MVRQCGDAAPPALGLTMADGGTVGGASEGGSGPRDRVPAGPASARELLALAAVFVATVAFAYAFNSKVAGGADSWGYVSEAVRLSQFRLYEPERVYSPFGVAESAAATHPLGYLERGPAGTVPAYPFGYPLLMVPLIWLFGVPGAFWLTPLLAGGAVVLTYWLGRALLGRAGGAVAALLVFVFPSFQFSAFNPMSDVPATFLAAAALVALLALPAGAMADTLLATSLGLAVWVRPNLVLLVGLVLVWLAVRGEWRRVLRLGVLLVPFAAVAAGANWYLFGAPWRTGYGAAPLGASFADAAARGWRHLGRLHQLQAGVGGFLLLASALCNRLAWPLRALLLAVFSAFLAFFACYRIDDQWWYFRFLLPALPAVAVLEAGLTSRVLQGERARWLRGAVVACAAVAFAAGSIRISQRLDLFTFAAVERKYVLAAAMTRRLVRAPAVVLAMQHSGSLRFYSGVPTTRYDADLPAQLPRLRAVEAAGGYVYLLAEDWEVRQLRGLYPDFDAFATPLGSVEPNHVTLFALRLDAAVPPSAH